MPNRKSEIGNRRFFRQFFAWHGWRLELPADWNPVRLEGGWASGFVLFANLHRPQLGLRWKIVRRKHANILKNVGISQRDRFDPQSWARLALRAEVGQLAARESRPLEMPDSSWRGSMIYLDPKPPGRDVWVAHSSVSGRAVELIHHVRKRDSTLSESIVPGLIDLPADQPMLWSIFDLSCVVPAGLKLRSHRLNAGDLRLLFSDRLRLLSIRQIAVAKLALSRMSLSKWLTSEQRTRSLHYRPDDDLRDAMQRCDDGRELVGIMRSMTRRRRFFFMRWLPEELLLAALHDPARDRLLLLQCSDSDLLEQTARSAGCSS